MVNLDCSSYRYQAQTKQYFRHRISCHLEMIDKSYLKRSLVIVVILGLLKQTPSDGQGFLLLSEIQGGLTLLRKTKVLELLVELFQLGLFLSQNCTQLPFQLILLLLLPLLQIYQLGQLNICLRPQLHVLLAAGLDGFDLLGVEFGEGLPELVDQIIAEFFVHFGPHQEDLFIFFEVILDDKRNGVIIFVSAAFEFKQRQSVEQFGEVLFIPVEYEVEVGVAGELAGVEFVIAGEYLDLAEFEFEVFHHDGVVAVVVEEKDVAAMLETIGLIHCVLRLHPRRQILIKQSRRELLSLRTKVCFFKQKPEPGTSLFLAHSSKKIMYTRFIQSEQEKALHLTNEQYRTILMLPSNLMVYRIYTNELQNPLQTTAKTPTTIIAQKLHMHLSPHSIRKMLAVDTANNQLLTVTAKKTGKPKGTSLFLLLSDGQDTARAVVDTQTCNIPELSQLSKDESIRIMVHEYTTHHWQRRKIIELTNLTVLETPNNIKQQSSGTLHNPKLEQSTLPKRNHSMKIEYADSSRFHFTQNQLKLQTPESDEETKPIEANPIDVKSFEKIEDLYVGLFGWEILVRVIDKSYKQFTSKNQRQVKILSLELIDRTGNIIEGVFFGPQAELQEKDIQKGSVYRIARARLQESSLHKKRLENYSPLLIKFNGQSSIVEVSDIPDIPYCSNNWIRLSQISQESSQDDHFNVVAILLQIGQERTLPNREQRTMVMQHLKIGDPMSNIIFDVVVWNKQVHVDPALLNRTVELKHFRVVKYKQNLNLSSTYRSDLVGHHLFREYQHAWFPLSKKPDSASSPFKTLKELSYEIKDMKESQSIKSTINAWVSSICLGMKWYYQACPNIRCNRAAVPFTYCGYCSTETWECVKRFSLNVELGDYTGSIFVTAFGEAASLLVQGLEIEYLASLADTERKSIADKLCFSNWKLVITSKADGNGKIRHNIVGKPEPINQIDQCHENLELIKRLKQTPVLLDLND